MDPDPDAESVKCLETYHDTLRCMSDEGFGRHCGYICRAVAGVQEHCNPAHQGENPSKRGSDVRERAAQTLIVPHKSCFCCQTFF